jgi:hypothetical protein
MVQFDFVEVPCPCGGDHDCPVCEGEGRLSDYLPVLAWDPTVPAYGEDGPVLIG